MISTRPPIALQLLRDPHDFGSLTFESGRLVNSATSRVYPMVNGIPVLLDGNALGPQNAKYQQMYDWICGGYDIASVVGNVLTFGKLARLRRLLAATAAIQPGQCCLFTSIGTGADLPYLAERVPLESVTLVGLDLSMGMLRRCQRHLRAVRETSLLVQANAERLPFAANVFDVAVHVGGINFFDDPAEAVREMVRVCRPGSLVLLADETKKVVERDYRRTPLIGKYFKDAPADFDPRSWVPTGATGVTYETLAGGKCYMLTFRTAA